METLSIVSTTGFHDVYRGEKQVVIRSLDGGDTTRFPWHESQPDRSVIFSGEFQRCLRLVLDHDKQLRERA